MDKTDWNSYYKDTFSIAKYSRTYTENVLNKYIKKYRTVFNEIFCIAEFGGANSCFLDSIYSANEPLKYIVVDNNKFGLNLLKQKIAKRNVVIYENDLLSEYPDILVDIVFSIGLIEHFDITGTEKIIKAHFDCLKPGGIAIISYPTPTILYLIARKIVETLGLWRFPDERPLKFSEIATIFNRYGQVLEKRILYPIVFTQQIVIVKKHKTFQR